MTTKYPIKSPKVLTLGISIFFFIALTFYIYLPGTSGLFILDDYGNLSSIGKYTNLSFWDNFWLFILEGKSGPTGRPISLASFYLNASQWPTNPSSFIYTNIIIHLINGVLLFWISLKLAKLLLLSPTQQVFFSLLISALWLLHPMHTTTVLYIVQRMTELSATFTLLGIIFYLYGREKLSLHKKTAFLLLFIGVGLSLLFSILSKENGILLVAYLLVIEFFLLQPLKHYPPKKLYYWLIPAVITPFIAVIIYLGMHTNTGGYAARNFTLTERLLTEPRIIFDYLQHILLPKMSYSTLFHDDFQISSHLFSPWTTLPAILGIIILSITALLVRKRLPLLAFAIAWFFAGHLIESTVLPLELYFEHRNYLPILGIMITIAYYAARFFSKKKMITLGLSVLFLCLFTFITFQNTTLWGKPVQQAKAWYEKHPGSLRAQELYRPIAHAQGLTLKKHQASDVVIKEKKSLFSSTIALLSLDRACSAKKITSKDLSATLQVLQSRVIHTSSSTALSTFIRGWLKGNCEELALNEVDDFLQNLLKYKNTQRDNGFIHSVHYYLSELYRLKKDFSKTMLHLDQAYKHRPSYDLLKRRAITLSSAGLFTEALDVLEDSSLIRRGLKAEIIFMIKQKELNIVKSNILKKI